VDKLVGATGESSLTFNRSFSSQFARELPKQPGAFYAIHRNRAKMKMAAGGWCVVIKSPVCVQ
jgi:hypothetical protein